MNAINNRFLKNVCMDFTIYGCAVNFDFFFVRFHAKILNWNIVMQTGV